MSPETREKKLSKRYQTQRSLWWGRATVRFWLYVNKSGPGGCWLWTGRTNRTGYGVFHALGSCLLAHRVAYKLCVGPIPEGLTLNHECRVRNCVNPTHLEPMSLRDNFMHELSQAVGAVNARKTHCVRGHEYTPENTVLWAGKGGVKAARRQCKTCLHERWRLKKEERARRSAS